MLSFIECLRFNAVATTSAAACYAFAMLVLLHPGFRHGARQLLAPPMPSTHQQFAALDSFRGGAASLVALAHIWVFCRPFFDTTQQKWWHALAYAGNKAVPMFVILSGFLIYRSVRRINSDEALRNYAVRRFLRIYPAYIFTVILGFLCHQMTFSFPDLLAQVFMVRTISQAYLKFANPPAWSLYVEALFYIVLPVWVVSFRKNVLAAALVSFVVLLFVDPLASRELWLWKYFFFGVIVSEVYDNHSARIGEKTALGLLLLGIVLLCLDFKGPKYDWFDRLGIVPKNQAEYTVGLAVSCGLILLGTIRSSLATRVLGSFPLRMLGGISYSMYLIHPFFVLAVFPNFEFLQVPSFQPLAQEGLAFPPWFVPFVMFPGVIAWSIASYLIVERPFLMMRPGQKRIDVARRATFVLQQHPAADVVSNMPFDRDQDIAR